MLFRSQLFAHARPLLRSQKWSRVREELPMPTVMSVAGRDGQVYFGTTGGLARFDTSFFNPAD